MGAFHKVISYLVVEIIWNRPLIIQVKVYVRDKMHLQATGVKITSIDSNANIISALVLVLGLDTNTPSHLYTSALVD